MPSTPTRGAVRHIAAKKRAAVGLTSAQWSGVRADIRERALFSACVTDAKFLEQIRRVCHAVTTGEMTPDRAKWQLGAWLERTGYQAEPGEEGTIKDLSSDGRLHLIVDTNCKLAAGYGREAWQAERQRLYPYNELYRAEQRKEPRDWPSRWRQAGGRLTKGRFIARFGDPIWTGISRFEVPYPIFDFNSGMWKRMLTAAQAARAGVKVPARIKPATVRGFNSGLQTGATRRFGPALRKAVAKNLPGFALGPDGVLRKAGR